MADAILEATGALAKAEDLTGMGIPESELTDVPPTEVKPEVKTESKPEVKTEEADTKGEEEEESEEETKVKDEDEHRPIRPAKNERPLKAAFTQIKELRGSLDKILSKLDNLPQAKQEAVVAVEDALKAVAEKRGLDAEGLAEIAEVLQKRILDNLEKAGVLKKDLPAEIQEKLKVLDKIQAEQKTKEEVIHFENEWTKLVADVQKQYPNAKAGELAEAKKTMDELAHSKEFHKYDLDYILFKNKSKFDTLLKVAKHSKSGETSSKQIEEFDENEDIDLDPETMTPDKMKAYQTKKMNQKEV